MNLKKIKEYFKMKIKRALLNIYTKLIFSNTQKSLIRKKLQTKSGSDTCYTYDLLLETSKKIDCLTKKIDCLTVTMNKNNFLLDIMKRNIDITQIPKATGVLRLVQEAGLIFLKMITDLCEENHLTYFINYGTLLGAVRHKGFIPWDDDIDICMLRDDYEKLVELLKNTPNIQYTLTDALRIHSNNLPIHVDVIVIDYYFKTITTDMEKEEFFQDKEKVDIEVQKNKRIDDRKDPSVWPYQKYIDFRDEFVLHNQKPEKKEGITLFRGIETWGNPRSYYKWEWVFPLKKYTFEKYEFWGPNREDILLFENYGDYTQLPDYIRLHGSNEIDLDMFIRLKEIV